MSMCRVFSCVIGRGCLLRPVQSRDKILGKTVLAFARLHSVLPRPNLPVTPGVFWLPTFAFQSHTMKRTSFLGVSSKRFVCVHRSVQLQLFQCYWLGHRLGLPLYWMVSLGNKERSFCHFWDCIQVLHFGLFCWPWWLYISSKGFLPTVVDIMVIWVKVTHCSLS